MVCSKHTHILVLLSSDTYKRERRAKERLRRTKLYSVHCTPVAHGGEIHPAKKKINTTAATVEKKRKEEASLESRSSDDGLFLAGETYCR